MSGVAHAARSAANFVRNKIDDVRFGISELFSSSSSKKSTQKDMAMVIAAESEEFISYLEKINNRSFNGITLNLNISELRKKNGAEIPNKSPYHRQNHIIHHCRRFLRQVSRFRVH